MMLSMLLLKWRGLFCRNIQVQAAGDNAEQTQIVIENEPKKGERLLLLTLSEMRKVLEKASDDGKPKEQQMTEIREIIHRRCIK